MSESALEEFSSVPFSTILSPALVELPSVPFKTILSLVYSKILSNLK